VIPPSPARRLARLLTVVSLVMSGLYLFVYLYRWEWNRALIAGVFFLGAEIALATSLILARLPVAGARAQAPPPAAPVRPEAEPEPGWQPFAWLAPLARGESFGVFVPVLLGAGVVLSTLAFAVERLAAAVTGGARRPGAPPQPAELRLPAGEYSHRRVVPAAPAGRGRARPARLAATAVLVVGAGVISLDALADATQARPDPRQAGTTVLVVEGERRSGPSATAAVRLWERCRTLLPSRLPITTESDRHSRVTVEVGTVLGPLAERKLRGCVEDASLPGIRGRVVSLERDPGLMTAVGRA
jgi:hypothetical protein